MSYDAIVFDIDGTLWDARESITAGWNLAIEELTGVPGTLESETFGQLFGKPLDALIDFALPGVPPERKAALGDYCLRRENEVLLERPGTLYPGVEDTLTELMARYPLFIVSNCGKGYIEAMLQGTGLMKYFSGWLCYADTNAPKDVTLRVLAKQYRLKNPVYVGDIQADADACARAGVDIIYAAYGLGEIAHPAATIHQFPDLLTLDMLWRWYDVPI
ncbi:MAG: HAD family hydrolase [Clostridiales bacterium]|nr:HAD family hydrolase [Clostridiales bacterium]